MLSGGEQQRVGLARVLIHNPDVVLLDEAVSVFEEAEARELYRMLFDKLPGAAIISVGRSSVLAGLHRRTFEMSGSPRAARDANLRTLFCSASLARPTTFPISKHREGISC